jgi:hypothetical protein
LALILLKTKVTGIANGYGTSLWDKKIVEENEKKRFLKITLGRKQ